MVREITADEFHWRTNGEHRDWCNFAAAVRQPMTGYYEIDLDRPATCKIGDVDRKYRGQYDMMTGWLDKAA